MTQVNSRQQLLIFVRTWSWRSPYGLKPPSPSAALCLYAAGSGCTAMPHSVARGQFLIKRPCRPDSSNWRQ